MSGRDAALEARRLMLAAEKAKAEAKAEEASKKVR